jgi:hypothetical protein
MPRHWYEKGDKIEKLDIAIMAFVKNEQVKKIFVT